jgi:hypothetical protein
MALIDYRILLDERIRDTAGILNPIERESAITEAMALYARHRPRRRVQTITGDGVTVTFALAADYEERFSRIESIEYPVDEQAPTYVDANEYGLYRDPTTGLLRLRFLELVMPAAATAYVAYTTRHTVDNAGQDTIPVGDREPVAALAASILALELATYYAQTTQPTLGADAVDYRSKSADYRSLADRYEARYRRHLGLPAEGPLAASAQADLDLGLAEGLGARFFHGARYR